MTDSRTFNGKFEKVSPETGSSNDMASAIVEAFRFKIDRWDGDPYAFDQLQDDIRGALSTRHLENGVRALEWHKHERTDIVRYSAEPEYFSYFIDGVPNGFMLTVSFWGSAATPALGPFSAVEEAKAAAQADYAARILSAIDTTTIKRLTADVMCLEVELTTIRELVKVWSNRALSASPASPSATGVMEALQEALKLSKLTESLCACRGDDDYVWGVQAKIEAALSAIAGQP